MRAAGRDNCGRWISRKFRGIEKSARLRLIPGQPLEALKGDRKGQDSIRVNDQFRVCLEWRDRDAYNVEIVDYH